ncbi:MAG: hypothetical protein GY697_28485 [Desulfobacterales bacterium]|nr:hypothetical protein [Desulfobacterales bacterium]
MKMKLPISACIIACLFTVAGCMAMPTPATHPTTADGNLARQYGEEVLAYMMQVVLGKAGDPDKRAKWISRGLDQGLDIKRISGIMSDPGGNKTTIMVNDPNILGLSKVLYHYAPEMSQFSGSYATSLYPATELVALRLFLLERLQTKRKVSIQSLLNHQQLLEAPQRQPTRAELAAMHLMPEEARLLQAVFKSKPWLFDSLTNPFLVEAFSRIGVLEKDPLTQKLISQAHYRDVSCTPMETRTGRESVTIAFLPSMTKEFRPGASGFNPTDEYIAVVETLKAEIFAACHRIALQAFNQQPSNPARHSSLDFKKHLDEHLIQEITFQTLNTQPLVIYPENAAKVIRETCPDADFAVIILGRNVYQAMHIEPERDIYPAVKRVYLDITDVKHSQVSSEIAEIGGFLYKKIKPRLSTADLQETMG